MCRERHSGIDCGKCGAELSIGAIAYDTDHGVICADCIDDYIDNKRIDDTRTNYDDRDLICDDCCETIQILKTYYIDDIKDALCPNCYKEHIKELKDFWRFEVEREDN